MPASENAGSRSVALPPGGDGPTSARAIGLPRVFATLGTLVLVALALHKIGVAPLRGALASASLIPLAVGALFSLSTQAAKAAYWRAIVAPVARVTFLRMLWYALSASGASVVLPLRGGEAIRLYALRRQHGVPLPTLGAALAFEKVADVASLVLLVLPLPWLLPELAWSRGYQTLVPIVVVALLFVLAVVHRKRRSLPWLANLRIFDGARSMLAASGWVLASWLADLVLILLVLRALGLPLHLGWALFVLLGANLAIAVPAAPGNLGTLELGVGLALTTLGVAQERAAAFAILYHGVQLVTLVAAWSVGAVAAMMAASRPSQAI